MSGYGAIRQQEGFCPLLLISIYFKKRVKAIPSPWCCLICQREGCLFQRHIASMFICYEPPPKESSGKESSPTGFNDAQIKGRDHSQDLIKRSLFVDLLIYL